MVEKVRLRNGRPSETIGSLIETLREYTDKVNELTRTIETQKTKIALVSYLLTSIALTVALFAIFLIQQSDFGFKFATPLLLFFLGLTAILVPTSIYKASNRYNQYRTDLHRATERLVTTMTYASQIKDHVSFEKIDDILMQLHLHEADEALGHAKQVAGVARDPSRHNV